MKNYRPIYFWLFFIALTLGAAFSLPSAETVASGFPTRPTYMPTSTPAPPSSTPTTVPTQSATPDSPTENEGALIFLHVPSPPPDLQTVVQWQDASDEWVDVEGWRGSLNELDFIVWWVAPRDLGAVWYRWLVYTEDGRIYTTSDAFSLPNRPNQALHIQITLSQVHPPSGTDRQQTWSRPVPSSKIGPANMRRGD